MKKTYTVEPAPMAGYTDLAFRKVLRKCGAKVTWTEMISVTALFHGSEKTKKMLESDGKTVVQLFGHNPTHFEAVIKSGILDKFVEININMGCPARKIISSGDGCALMKNPELAREIIKACGRPVSVKIRLGYSPSERRGGSEADGVGVEFAKMCEAAGASRIIVHGRYGTQGYSGKADWNAIKEIVHAVKIPVVANGDIRDAKHAAECIRQTGATGVMIGRALIGSPWSISCKKIDYRKIIKYHIEHADNILELRKHLIAYARDKEIKKRLAVCKSFEEAKEVLDL